MLLKPFNLKDAQNGAKVYYCFAGDHILSTNKKWIAEHHGFVWVLDEDWEYDTVPAIDYKIEVEDDDYSV